MYDYVIVGGGSAGCVLANRLSADGRHSVCLLEAGPRDTSPFIHMPGGMIAALRSKTYNWNYWTCEQPLLGNRKLYWPRGRTLGGSSCLNAMVYIRGHASDYDGWAALGNDGWSWRDVLPLFREMEHYEAGLDERGRLPAPVAEFHGTGGPLNVAKLRHTNVMSQVFLDAARQAGHTATPDFNGAHQEGLGFYDVMQKNGQRCSNAVAYLRDAEKRRNLTVVTGAHATRIIVQGKRATGVTFVRGGALSQVDARREVIVCGGAVGSPQLLMLSGIGAAEPLRELGIRVVHDLPGVGANLQDHVDVLVSMRASNRLALSLHPTSLWRTLKALWQYIFKRQGEMTSNVAEAGVFFKTRPSEPVPDVQMHFVPLLNTTHGQDLTQVFRNYGYSILSCDLRPRSRGEITLASADPMAPPRIDPRHLADPADMDKLVIALKKAREIFAQSAFAQHNAVELEPGPEVQTDEQIRDWIRAHIETLYHPVGTCRMGRDAGAVVDARLRVHGIERLRVIDASIMPTLVGGNTNAPTTMIAEKGARMVLEDAASAGAAVASRAEAVAA
jgi:choline dehydrogenase